MCDCGVDEYTARRQAEADGAYEERLIDEAVREEREAVVRWLRGAGVNNLADGIEAGEHRKEADRG